jgi:hypothetical protein
VSELTVELVASCFRTVSSQVEELIPVDCHLVEKEKEGEGEGTEARKPQQLGKGRVSADSPSPSTKLRHNSHLDGRTPVGGETPSLQAASYARSPYESPFISRRHRSLRISRGTKSFEMVRIGGELRNLSREGSHTSQRRANGGWVRGRAA